MAFHRRHGVESLYYLLGPFPESMSHPFLLMQCFFAYDSGVACSYILDAATSWAQPKHLRCLPWHCKLTEVCVLTVRR